uniref:Uncharacterized protein n=1 Tax=Panagrolaimus davidi TaxID=227884 RepID=A0A914P8Y9_9BILA
MNSSNPASATSSNRKCKAEDSIMVNCKRTKFMKTYHRQNFSMPDSVVFFVAKNPKTAVLYLKMVKTCKYFFIKNSILVIHRLYTYGGKWKVNAKPLDLTKYTCKYWIADEIYASARGFVDKNIFLPIVPKLYRCDVKSLFLYSQIISYNDLSLLISSAERIRFIDVNVRDAESTDVPIEDIVAIAVNAKYVYVTKPIITRKTMKELTKLPNFTKVDNFTLNNLSEAFDIEAFYSYMKKNQHTKFYIRFDPQISDAFKNRLKTIVDEILETKQFNYKPPCFYFTGIGLQKIQKLRQFYNSH